jgi:hypothetical protein
MCLPNHLSAASHQTLSRPTHSKTHAENDGGWDTVMYGELSPINRRFVEYSNRLQADLINDGISSAGEMQYDCAACLPHHGGFPSSAANLPTQQLPPGNQPSDANSVANPITLLPHVI